MQGANRERGAAAGAGEAVSIPTTHPGIQKLFDWLYQELQDTPYGRCGLVFTLHDSAVVRVEKVMEIKGDVLVTFKDKVLDKNK